MLLTLPARLLGVHRASPASPDSWAVAILAEIGWVSIVGHFGEGRLNGIVWCLGKAAVKKFEEFILGDF